MHKVPTKVAFAIDDKKSAIGKRFAGFTLTETIVASALLLIAIVPTLEGLSIARRNTRTIGRRTRSLILAQAKLDEIKTRLVYQYTDTFTQSSLSLDGLYLCDITDTSAETNLRKIVVSVGYDLDEDSQLAGDEVLITLSTLIAKRW